MAKKGGEADALRQLKEQLKTKELGRLYVFYGEEQFLKRYYLDKIRDLVVDALTESFNYHAFHAENFDIQSFGDAVESFPMMAERTLVTVDDVSPFDLDSAGREAMARILRDIPDFSTVVFSFETVKWKPDRERKELTQAFQSAQIVEFAKQSGRELVAWVSRHFAGEGKRISNELCQYLIDMTDGTMTSLLGEIQKVCAYSDAPEICQADLDAVVEPVLDALVYQMTDALGRKNYDQALEKLRTLLKMQTEPLVILGAIGSHFRRLGRARPLQDAGRGCAELARASGTSDYPAPWMMETSRRFSGEFCRRAAELVMETDYKMKTSFDDPQRLLELLVVQLAQEAERG